jgi:hypothetical protein
LIWRKRCLTLAINRVIELLVAVNTSVMQRRHGAAAWIAIEAGGKIRVRRADERGELSPVDAIEDRWRSTYFINALWRVSRGGQRVNESAVVERKVLSEAFQDAMQGWRLRSAVFLTFRFDAGFFEQQFCQFSSTSR